MTVQNSACTHDSFMVDPVDTTGNPIDTMPIDTTPFIPCEDGVIYFEYDVLPILISNCSVPTCHDDESHEHDIVLTSYDKVMASGKVKPFDLSDSDLFERITDTDVNKRMPKVPRIPLNQEQIQVIATWILQGAQDLTCDLDTLCDSENVSFSSTVYPIIQTNCRGCHSGQTPTGGISLETYSSISSIAQSGRLFGAIARLPGFTPMPKNRGPLQNCEIIQIKSWIDAGTPDN